MQIITENTIIFMLNESHEEWKSDEEFSKKKLSDNVMP